MNEQIDYRHSFKHKTLMFRPIYSQAGLIPSARYAPACGRYLWGVFLNLLKFCMWVLNPHKIHSLQNDDTPLLCGGVRHFFFCLSLLFILASCKKPELAVWSNHSELNELFLKTGKTYKKLAINCQPFSNDDIDSLKPGLFVLEGTALDPFVKAGNALDVTDAVSLQETPLWYRDGHPYAVFLNSGTGVFCYDSQLIGQYLYVTEPDAVQEQFKDLNSFIVSSFLIHSRSESSCAILPSVQDLRSSFLSGTSPTLQRSGLDHEKAEKWFDDIQMLFNDFLWDGLTDKDGNPRRTALFFLESNQGFMLPMGVAAQTPDGAAWMVIRGPYSQSNGGLWLALHRDIFKSKKSNTQKIKAYLSVLLTGLEDHSQDSTK